MNRFGRLAFACSALGFGNGLRRVMREQRRNLERDPAVDPGRSLVDRREHVGGLGQVLDRQLEKQRLTCLAGTSLTSDLAVVRMCCG